MMTVSELSEALLRASLVLLVSGLVLTVVLRLMKPRAVWLYRFRQDVLLMRIPVRPDSGQPAIRSQCQDLDAVG